MKWLEDLLERVLVQKFSRMAVKSEYDILALSAQARKISKVFYNEYLPNYKFNTDWIIELPGNTPLYRVCGLNRIPVGIAGSLQAGARMNVGGSQSGPTAMVDFKPYAKPQGALYTSYCKNTALTEWLHYLFGDDTDAILSHFKTMKNAGLFELTSKKEHVFKIVNFNKIYKDFIENSEADKFFQITQDFNGKWPDLKAPMPIQLFAHWLKISGNLDGISFESTVRKGHDNLVLYFDSDITANTLIKYQQIKI